ncbi:MAG: ATP-grasp domain-containing protein [Pseudobutyrivibrio sp.]|nr:ATP-grasp domain-containing protein [Pseudobutyrivibrio sp.]
MSSKNKLAIIGASYLQLPLIEKAKEMGYETHVFAWAAGDVGEDAADYFYPISIVEKEEILAKCKEIGICGICSIASDLAMITVNYVANGLGLVCNSPEATKKSTNKNAMRNAFAEGGDPSPKSIHVYDASDLCGVTLEYPVIVKPLDRSGSRGITKVETPDGLHNAIEEAKAQGFDKSAMVEEYIRGTEYSVEFISQAGNHHFLALTRKYTTGAPHFIEVGHLEPAPVSNEALEKVKKVVAHALDTLGIENGASHSELKIDENGNIKIVEIGGRMGGDMIGSHLVYYSTGIDFVKNVILVAIGQDIDLEQKIQPSNVAVRYVFNQDDYRVYQDILADENVIIIYSQCDDNLDAEVHDSSERMGCVVFSCDDIHRIESYMREG